MAHDLVCWKCGAALAELSLPLRRSEEHTSELQSQSNLVCRLLLEKKKNSATRFSLALPAPSTAARAHICAKRPPLPPALHLLHILLLPSPQFRAFPLSF